MISEWWGQDIQIIIATSELTTSVRVEICLEHYGRVVEEYARVTQ